jgi:hypothetical protein
MGVVVRRKKSSGSRRERSPLPRPPGARTSSRERRPRHDPSCATPEQLRSIDNMDKSTSPVPATVASPIATVTTARLVLAEPPATISSPRAASHTSLSQPSPLPCSQQHQQSDGISPNANGDTWPPEFAEAIHRGLESDIDDSPGLPDVDAISRHIAAPQARMAPSMTSTPQPDLTSTIGPVTSDSALAGRRATGYLRSQSEIPSRTDRPQTSIELQVPESPRGRGNMPIASPSQLTPTVDPLQTIRTESLSQAYSSPRRIPPASPTDSGFDQRDTREDVTSEAQTVSTSMPPPPRTQKQMIGFQYTVVKARTPNLVVSDWIPQQRFSSMSLAAFEQDVPHQLPVDARGWQFTLAGPGIRYMGQVPRGRDDIHKATLKSMERRIRDTISRNRSMGQIDFFIEVGELVDQEGLEFDVMEYTEELEF